MEKKPEESARAAEEAKRLRASLMCRIKLGGILFALLWLVWIVAVLVMADRGLISQVGAFGDSMAFIGSIATALALLVSAYSMLLQREDIDSQLDEMRGSKEAQESLAEAQRADTRARRIDALLRMTRETLTWVEGTIAAERANLKEARDVQRQLSIEGRANSPEATKVAAEIVDLKNRLTKLQDNFMTYVTSLEGAESALVTVTADAAGDAELAVLAKNVLQARTEWRQLLGGPS